MSKNRTKLAPNRADAVITGLFVTAAIGFGIAAYRQYDNAKLTAKLAAEGRYNATIYEVIGTRPHYRGGSNCPYTLVEFGDYQCMPCRMENEQVKEVLRTHQNVMRYVFRNLPLTSIHPLALHAAVVAEEAVTEPDFWAVHDTLYAGRILDQTRIVSAQALLRVSGGSPTAKAVAERTVANDVREAALLP